MADVTKILNELNSAIADMSFRVEESLASDMLRREDIGWVPIEGWDDNSDDTGPSIDMLKRQAKDLRSMTVLAPHMVRGAQLHHSYVFGRGVQISNVEGSRAEKFIKDPENQETLFGVQGQDTLTKEEFCTGNTLIMRNIKTQELTLVPFEQVTGVVIDDDDTSKIRYVQRTWNRGGTTAVRWFATGRLHRKLKGRIQKTIGGKGSQVAVDQEHVFYIKRNRRQAGWTWGVPTAIAAKTWALSYSNYLADMASLTKALSKIAWKMTSNTPTGQANAAGALRQPHQVGGTVTQGMGNDFSSVGVPSANVSFQNGQPLAAMVATALGVPVIALLSDSGAGAGSYGAATTLDDPTVKGFRAVQDSWKTFFEEILRDMGAPENAEVTFPALKEDPTYRAIQSLAQAYATGAVHQDEYREAVLPLLDLVPLHEEVPEIPDVGVPGQGQTGEVPGGFDQDETNNDGVGE